MVYDIKSIRDILVQTKALLVAMERTTGSRVSKISRMGAPHEMGILDGVFHQFLCQGPLFYLNR